MPTGYTAAVADGTVTDFRTFALRCARQFGATIMQRDDDPNDPPKLRTASTHYRERRETADARLAALGAMTPDAIEAAARADHEQALAAWREAEAHRAATRARYETMLAEVVLWTPPTPEHAGLKAFMEQQLRESLDFDCRAYGTEPHAKAPAAWLGEQVRMAARDLAYYADQEVKERERVAGANTWIVALYQSLGTPTPTEAVAC